MHLCVERFAGSRSTRARPTYITVGYGGGPQEDIGSVVANELKCFQLAGGSFNVQLSNTSVVPSSAAERGQEVCKGGVAVSGMRTGWLKIIVDVPSGTPPRCPWVAWSNRGSGPLPTHPPPSDLVAEKDFLVLPAIASYAEARRVAGAAARQLGLKLQLRGARPDGHGELTFSRAECEANDWDYPCYVARGRSDDGAYVSIDDASRFFDYDQRGYLVILGSGPKGNPSLRALAEKARALFPSAELRTDDVSEGCIH